MDESKDTLSFQSLHCGGEWGFRSEGGVSHSSAEGKRPATAGDAVLRTEGARRGIRRNICTSVFIA